MVCAAPTAGGRYEGQPTCQASSSACFLYRALPCAGGVSLTLPGASGEEESHRLELRTHRAEVVELLASLEHLIDVFDHDSLRRMSGEIHRPALCAEKQTCTSINSVFTLARLSRAPPESVNCRFALSMYLSAGWKDRSRVARRTGRAGRHPTEGDESVGPSCNLNLIAKLLLRRR